jgi:hypothetical protein
MIAFGIDGCATAVTIKNPVPPSSATRRSFMKQAADELEKFPNGSPTVQFINGHLRMRNISRKIKLS